MMIHGTVFENTEIEYKCNLSEMTPPGRGWVKEMTTKQLAIYLSRELRKKQTHAEAIFWKAVRSNRFLDSNFLRQHPIFFTYREKEKFFIADFYCRRLKLIIEIDGGIHQQQADYDQIRCELLSIQHDLEIIRFTNSEIMNDINNVLLKIKEFVTHK